MPGPDRLPLTGLSKDEVLADVGSMRWGDFKPRLADALVAHLEPIQRRYTEVMEDEGALDAILAKVGGQAGAAHWFWCLAEDSPSCYMSGSTSPGNDSRSMQFDVLCVVQGADAAATEAYATLDNVRQAMGFGTVKAGRRL